MATTLETFEHKKLIDEVTKFYDSGKESDNIQIILRCPINKTVNLTVTKKDTLILTMQTITDKLKFINITSIIFKQKCIGGPDLITYISDVNRLNKYKIFLAENQKGYDSKGYLLNN